MTPNLTKHSLVQEAEHYLKIEPSVLTPELDLAEIAARYSERPECHVLCVTDPAGKLLGQISVRNLFEDLFARIAPESLLADMRSPGKAATFSRLASARTARDLMSPPISVQLDSEIGEAFAKMHASGLEGLPIVDALGVLCGYLDMAELLFAWLQSGLSK